MPVLKANANSPRNQGQQSPSNNISSTVGEVKFEKIGFGENTPSGFVNGSKKSIPIASGNDLQSELRAGGNKGQIKQIKAQSFD